MEVMTKDKIQNALWAVYKKNDYDTLVKCAWELMVYCERHANLMEYRQMKGEIAEVVLDFGLRELQNQIKPSIVLKGLCIPMRDKPNSTTEMDLLFITSRKIYMFECKSYKNKPKVTGECTLNGNMDIASQSRFHLKGLHQYIGRLCKRDSDKPYKFIFFEMSTEGVDDLRTDENKERIPMVNPNDFIIKLAEDYAKSSDGVWNVKEVAKVLEPLARNSDDVFKKHLNRMIHKRK